MARILVPFDGSKAAKKALEQAETILEPEDEVIVAYIVRSGGDFIRFEDRGEEDADQANDGNGGTQDHLFSEAKEVINKVVLELIDKGIKVMGIVEKGADIPKKILDVGIRYNCKLIVVGYRNIENIGGFSLGSIAEKVVQSADRPVLIVK